MNTIRRVKIIGAGSIGNHLAHACRRHGWDVTVVDLDSAPLRRMREEIYPKRYGAWDHEIKLVTVADEPRGGFDVIFIGTPPDVRLDLALHALTENPKVLQLEKPLFGPTDSAFVKLREFLYRWEKLGATMVVVGYDHTLNRITHYVDDGIRLSGRVQTIDVEWREHWDGIFAAHPWLSSGPASSYLGFWKRGGGASGEHSHALNLWQHFAYVAGWGRVSEVTASMQMAPPDGGVEYDMQCLLTLYTDSGHIGRVVQDVITKPTLKRAMIVTDQTRMEWRYGWSAEFDKVIVGNGEHEFATARHRPDDFYREVAHISALLGGSAMYDDSPIHIARGIETMDVLRAAHLSHSSGRSVKVQYHV